MSAKLVILDATNYLVPEIAMLLNVIITGSDN